MRTIFVFFCLFILILTVPASAQDIFYPEIEPLLSAAQKQELEKAVNILLKARGNENNANDIERKYSKLKKRGNYDKWIFKTWEAKQQKIMAEKHYKNAYNTISNVYSELINSGNYESAKTKTEALALNKEAKSKFSNAENILTQYVDLPRETLEETSNDQVDSTLHESHLLKLTGIELQIVALEKITGIGKKAGQDPDDELAWEKAKKANSISSFYEYLNNNPRGRHMIDANDMISKIEKESANEDVSVNSNNKNNKNARYNPTTNNDNGENNTNLNNNNTKKIKGNLIFKVQIAASKSELSQWMLNAKAPGIKNIKTREADGWIKYMVGEFGSYSEAADYRDELRSHVPDAFIVVFNNGNQIEVTNEMKM